MPSFVKAVKNMKIVLASASPRRKEILENLGLEFEICPSDVDESIKETMSPEDAVIEVSKRKALSCLEKYKKDALVISADTVVCLDNKIIGKPKDKEDAFDILKSLSGKEHFVFTGYTLLEEDKIVTGAVKTKVVFKELSDEEILWYIDTKEPLDKAGAYGIQGKGSVFVKEISGDYLNVVGLPVSEIFDKIKEIFNLPIEMLERI